jgi:hypothetical protein
VTPPASPVVQDDIPWFSLWGVTAEQIAQGGTWPSDEELYAEHECLHGWVLIKVSIKVCTSIGDLVEGRTACRCS